MDLTYLKEFILNEVPLYRVLCDVTQDADIPNHQILLNNFYTSTYVCPLCGKHMFKTVFPIGKEYTFKDKRNASIIPCKRIFTCIDCAALFAPIPNEYLSSGTVYFVQYSPNVYEYYKKHLELLDYLGTTNGRLDV